MALHGSLSHKSDSGDTTPLNLEAKNAIENVARAFEEFKSKNDQNLAEISKKKIDDVVLREQVDRINASIDAELKKRDDEIIELKRQAIFAKSGQGENAMAPELADYAKKMNAYLRGEYGSEEKPRELKEALAKAMEVKALATNSDIDGGFTVIPQVDQSIREIQLLVSPIRDLAQVQTISTGSLKFLANQRGTAAGWVGETDTRSPTATSTFKEIEVTPGELYAQPVASQQMLEDSFINVEQWMANEVALKFAQVEGAAFISGDGVKKPKGFLSYTVVADTSWSWGNVGYIPTGSSGAFVSPAMGPPVVQGADVFLDLISYLKPGYRPNAQFLANRRTIAAMRKLKTVYAEYLWAPGLNGGAVDSFAGYPLAQVEDMPDIAANSYSIAFGDFKQFYLIVDRVGVSLLRDPYTNKPYVNFYTRKRVGGAIQNFEAAKLLKFSAS